MIRKIAVAAAMSLAMVAGAGCAGAPEKPEQTVFAIKNNFDAALVIAVAYRELKPCETPAKPPCSNPNVVAQLRRARDVAVTALDAAEAIVRDPAFGAGQADSAIAAARAALGAFESITNTLKEKTP